MLFHTLMCPIDSGFADKDKKASGDVRIVSDVSIFMYTTKYIISNYIYRRYILGAGYSLCA